MKFTQDIYKFLCRKWPNRNIFIISDQHFFHNNIINYERGEFLSLVQMHDYIISKHNEIVGNDDIVIFLGDFCFKNSELAVLLARMNGHKYLVIGNHDNENLVRNGKFYGFEGVFKNPVRIQNNYLSHEPLIHGQRSDLQFDLICKEFKTCSIAYNYHGHIHSRDDGLDHGRYKNVTCEGVDYQPVLVGKTVRIEEENQPLFINSPYFLKTINNLRSQYDVNALLADYFYTMILELGREYSENYVVQGSFGLAKKYNYWKELSDLDISFIYDSNLSKSKNATLIKEMVDNVYEGLKEVDGVNLSFVKRYYGLRQFEIDYMGDIFTRGYLDANMIFLDCYKPGDFIILTGGTYLERVLPNDYRGILDDYRLPKFKVKFLNLLGDIVNLTLQVLFQRGYDNKRRQALKKLYFVCKKINSDLDIQEFSDMFTRYFLKNLTFFDEVSRLSEISFVQKKDISNDIKLLPPSIRGFVEELWNSDNLKFKSVYNVIANTKPEDVKEQVKKLILENRGSK